MQHCFINRYKKKVSLVPIEFCVILTIKGLHLRLKALKRKYIWSDLHFIVDEKVKIFIFMTKTNLGDLQF